MRIRTKINPRQGYVLADQVDHVTTDIELAAASRVMAAELDGSPITWDEALDRDRRAAIHLLSDLHGAV